MSDQREALAILNELGVTVVPKSVMPRPGQTRSVGTLQRIIRRHGAEHGRLVVMVIVESTNNLAALDEASLGAVSDILLAIRRSYPDIYVNDMTKVFEFFDVTPIANIRAIFTDGVDGIIPRRFALGGMLWERVVRVFGQPQMDILDDRRKSA